MSNRTTLKSYFLTGATPTEANFADLIDSVLVLEEDLTDSLSLASSDLALTASAGKTLNDSITALTSRVVTLEGAESDFASNYYTKSESDSQISGINDTINALPFAGQISDTQDRVSALESVTEFPPSGHYHDIADIRLLGDALADLALKSYVDNLVSDINTTIAGLETGSDESAEVASLQAQVDTINTSISSLPTSEDLDAKSDTGHTHTVANITDISSSFYNKSETDTLLSNVVPKPHTHVEADITNLDKYTTGAIDLKLADHNTRTDNPHSVSAAQIGLDKVENLTVAEIFQSSQAQLLATKAELDAAVSGADGHSSRTDNPHSVTKAQVGLSDVPNVNFQALLDNHLSATNPHNIDLSYFDVYSESETDARIQFYLDAFRYNFKPASETDGAGAVGDIAYHDTGLYFKFGPTEWRQLLTSKTFNDGSPGSSFQIDTPKLEVVNGNTTLFEVDSTTNTTSINTTNVDITGQVSLGSGLTAVGAVSLGNTLNVSGNTVLSTLRATAVTTDSINSGSGTIQTTGELKGGSTTVTSLNSGSGTIQTTGQLKGGATTVTSLSAGSGAISTTGTLSTGSATVTSLSAGSGSISTTGTLSTGGATVTSLSAGSGSISTTGTLSTGAATVTSLSAGSGSISTTGTLSTGAATVTSLSAGSGAISTTGTLSTGGATVTSLSAGSGSISTTGSLSAGAISGTTLTLSGNNTTSGSTSTVGISSTSGGTFTGAGVTIGTASANQTLTVHGSLTTGAINASSLNPNNTVKAQSGDLILEGKDGNKVQVNDALDVVGATTLKGTTIGTSSANQNLTVNGNITASGNLTINGTTTTIDTTNLLIEDNIVVLNKNQTGTPPNTLKSGIEVERGTTANTKIYFDESNDKWKVDVAGVIKTIAFTEDLYSV